MDEGKKQTLSSLSNDLTRDEKPYEFDFENITTDTETRTRLLWHTGTGNVRDAQTGRRATALGRKHRYEKKFTT